MAATCAPGGFFLTTTNVTREPSAASVPLRAAGWALHLYTASGTVLALLAESHASLHTYPESGDIFVDVFTCGTSAGSAEAVAEQLRQLMRAVVTSGHAPAVAGLGEVYGKTGTAEFTGEGRSHGWFIGFRGDLAFAVLVVDGGSSSVAVEVAGRFLGALPG